MSSHTRAALSLAATFAALTIGCPRGSGQQDFEQFPSLTTADPQAESDLRAARQAADAGEAATAEQRYRAFLVQHPDDPLVPVAKLGLGRVLLANGELDEALTLLEQVSRADDPAVSEAGRFYRGVGLQLSGQYDAAIELLTPMLGHTTDPQRTTLLLRTLAAAAQQLGRTSLALQALSRLVVSEGQPEHERDEARGRIRAIVDAAAAEEVGRAYSQLGRDDFAWRVVAARLIRLAFDEGHMARVAEIVAELRRHDVPMTDALAELAVRAERTERADPRVIGAIAPLTGRARQIGQRVSRGLMLASGPMDGPPDPEAPQLVLRDDGGDPARAAAAVEALVSEHRAIAIIGPLEGRGARLAAQRAQDLGVPLLTLVPDPTVTGAGAMVFRLYPGPREEADALVAAAARRAATRFAILSPATGYGRRMAEAFSGAVQAASRTVVAHETYEAGATAFGEAIQRLAAQPFDALFVPDAGRQLNLIGPALAAAGFWSVPEATRAPRGARAITLLAPSVGVDRRILVASRYFQGALFASAFHAPSATDAGREFVQRYEQRFGGDPDTYAALAYDAFQLIRGAVEAGNTTRADVARWLTGSTQATASAVGGLSDGRVPRLGTRILEVRGDAFVPLDAP